jgi:hypothetical protein
MAKRARGTAGRPGQRRPMQRPPARPAARPSAAAPQVAPRPTTLTAEEEARASELEAAIVAAEQAAERARGARPQRGVGDTATQPVSGLARAAGNEYAYVARDVRRVVKVAGTLVIILAALWVFHQVTGTTL